MNAVPRHRAFTINELLISLALIAGVMMIATRLFHVSIRGMRTAQTAQGEAAKFDHLLTVLRADVWGARDASIRKPIGSTAVAARVPAWRASSARAARAS